MSTLEAENKASGDATNRGVPAAGGELSGDATRNIAIRRMKSLEERGVLKKGPNINNLGPAKGS